MKRIVYLFLIAALLVASLPVFAGNNTLTGTITGDLGFIENFDINCQPYNVGIVFYYEIYTIYISQAGDYSYINNGPINSYSGIYSYGGFNPDTPTANCVDAAGDTETLSVPAAGFYTLVVSTFSPDITGSFSFNLNGPGDIYYATPEEAACDHPLPTDSVVHSVPAGAPMFYEANSAAQIDLTLPAGTWWITQLDGDFVQVWIACNANMVWIPANAVGAPVG